MKVLGLNELRTLFKDFYVSKGHLARESFSLVPSDDKSLLLINSGMAPLKPYFAGLVEPPSKRMTTCQKCIRTGDLENVGHTSRHGTFFEMLGSFSFGDYFKRESLKWGWEFVIEQLEMPIDKIWATVYLEDDEAYDIWVDEIGIDPDKVVRLGKEDNFWEIGTGPCGPCSEMYFDRGEKYGCGSPDCKPGCECDRYVEFWNHVFTQFNRDENDNYTPLAHPNIDTGLGLERLSCILQNTDSIFDVDTIKYILDYITEVSGVKYEDGTVQTDVSIRIITDHIRSVVFMISDNIFPSAEGRGYVLRRLLRRATVHAKKLGIKRQFLAELADKVIETCGDEYPVLRERADHIKNVISQEEERFAKTIDLGNDLIEQYIDTLNAAGSKVLGGDKVFQLYDTYGMNPELTAEILEEHGIDVDMDGYEKELKLQQERSRSTRNISEDEAWAESDKWVVGLPKTEFTGYDSLSSKAKVLRIISSGAEVTAASEGQNIAVILDKTPLYAEGGGQASDEGLFLADNFKAEVSSVKKVRDVYVHNVGIVSGSISVGDELTVAVTASIRNKTARNHTATHLLQRALRDELGDHVQQAGSSVNEDLLRFDFTHFEAVKPEILSKIELIVNSVIDDFKPVITSELSLDKAKEKGAMALFDEKYADVVRVVEVGDYSMELCGGTHVKNSGEIGAFKIVSESSVGSGIRRIEALTGSNVLKPLKKADEIIASIGSILKSNPDGLVDRAGGLVEENKEIRAKLEGSMKDQLSDTLATLIASAEDLSGGGKLVMGVSNDTDTDGIKELADRVRDNIEDVIVALASTANGKVVFVVAVSKSMQAKGYKAGDLVKSMATAAGGGGGGKPDFAQAGAKDPSKVEDAFAALKEAI